MTEQCTIVCPIVRRFKFVAVLLALMVVLSLPWKEWGAHELKGMLEAKGYKDVSFTIKTVDLWGAVVTDVKLSNEFDLMVDDITVDYSVYDYLLHIIGVGGAPQINVRADNIVAQKDEYVLAIPLAFIDIKLGQALHGTLLIPSASMPFMDGHVTTKDLSIPLEEPRTIHAQLDLHRVSVSVLLGVLTGSKPFATGWISGALPVTINPDGNILFHKGALKAEKSGVIMMPADIIPGDHEQVEFVRQVLKNFHYDLLSMTLDSAPDQKMTIGLRMEGKNPDVMQGREIKLNVNLTGDMINLMQQNMMIFGDPQKLLKRGQDE